MVRSVSKRIYRKKYCLSNIDFSDKAKWDLVSSDKKRELELAKDSDGEFYMNFNRDFLRYFGELELVHLTPGSMGEETSSEKYDVFPFKGKWSGATAGGCGNDAISKTHSNKTK